MNRCSHRRILLALAMALLLWMVAWRAHADTPVVRAVLFYSPTCGHCHKVITEDLPPLFREYGDRLQVIGINTADPGGSVLFNAAAGGVVSMGISVLAIAGFIIPGIMAGNAPLLVCTIGALSLMTASLYLVYGWTWKTHTALAGLTISLVATALLAVLFARLAHLAGLGSDLLGRASLCPV